MKTITRFCLSAILVLSYGKANCQNYQGEYLFYFFGHQPSARAEAMGRGMVAIPGDAQSYYYNPAGLGTTEGLSVTGSLAAPVSYFAIEDEGSNNFFSASYKINQYATVGLSRDYFNYGYSIQIRNGSGNILSEYEPKLTGYRLSFASEVIEDLYVGTNLNLFEEDSSPILMVGNESTGGENTFYMDLGVLKSFKISKGKLLHNFSLGAGTINLTFSDVNSQNPLPVIFRLGGSYDLLIDDRSISKDLSSYEFILNIEYLDLLNSKYFQGIHAGFEFTFLEALSLRAGYYTQDIQECENCKDNLSEFTYGLGLNIPVRQLSDGKTPMEFRFDFVSLPQTKYVTNDNFDLKNFQTYAFTFNWIF